MSNDPGDSGYAERDGLTNRPKPERLSIDELSADIRFRPHATTLTWSWGGTQFGGIQLIVAGATIIIGDFYDRPLSLIYEQLRASWSSASND